MPDLSWKHHTLVQALLSKGPLQEKEFFSIFSAVTGKRADAHQQLFNEYLSQINRALAYVQFELRACRNQYDGSVYYGVVNNVADEQSKLGTKYSAVQIAFYKAVLEAIVQDGATLGCITNIGALNLSLENQIGQGSQGGPSHIPSTFKNFTMSQKEKTLEDLIQDRWLCLTSNGNVGLGVRSFLDLRSWFRSNDVPLCDVCNEAGVKVDICSNRDCAVRIHEYCLKKKFSQKRVQRICPGCKTDWAGSSLPTEEATEASEEDTQTQEPSSSSAGPVTRRRLKRCKAEQGDEADVNPPPAMVRRTRHSQRIK
ncbi:hypothetical protein H6P81_003242 [Aristolochia fimbriata]|uniref:Non-structural maintenance of chromosomes element 1 homolog n=1 Tax=Aristolochia fimbriata TaxID=158543 RepID=A0AAV7FDQ5_ARIFI|nr:hypothetical protein H6P81_003242 [Aristolochia fimbriata]